MSKTKYKKPLHGFFFITITKKIALIYGGLFSLSLMLLSSLLLFNISTIQESSLKRELSQTVNILENYVVSGNQLSNSALEGLQTNQLVEISIIDFTANEIYATYGDETAQVYEILLHLPEYNSPLSGLIPENAGVSEISEEENFSGTGRNFTMDNSNNQKLLVNSKSFVYNGHEYLALALKVIDSTGNDFVMKSIFRRILFIDLIGIICSFLVGLYISQKILHPMDQIRTMAEMISIEDLSQRLPVDGPDDEMKELKITFNSMIARLEESFQKQNQFVSDASHELRTPIAVIRGYANLINRWGKSDTSILQESIDSIISETDHMNVLIKQLIFLAKGDKNMLHTEMVPINLKDIAQEILQEIEIMEIDRIVTLNVKEDVTILGDADMLKQLMNIHLENAVKYSKDGSLIEIRVWKDEKNAYISIQDHGVGISADDQKMIFDRFYRADKSRNKEIPGNGLGLSIASWIAQAHNGTIQVESTPDEGSCFTDVFPLFFEKK